MIADNLQQVRERIEKVCFRCGRQPADIRLIAVSKTFPVQTIHEAQKLGIQDFGENYIQELQEKRKAFIDAPIRWHVIGHLQTNKVKYIAEYVHLIHSVDSIELGKEIAKRAEKYGRVQDILVEVHTTDEATKFGVAPEKTKDLIRQLSGFSAIRVKGLMTMGPFSDDPNDSRPSFATVTELKRDIERDGIENVAMQHLSMGMTHDFEVAIEEGATMIRIGTAIFGERRKNIQ